MGEAALKKNTAAIVSIKADLGQSRADVTLSTVDYGLVRGWARTDLGQTQTLSGRPDSVSQGRLCQRYFICPQFQFRWRGR